MSSIVLSIDTSTKTVGLALYDGVQVLSESVWTSHELAPAVSDLLRKSGLEVSSLGALTVALGPGSFTGLRIGMGLAKGMCLAGHLPLVGIPTLDALAASQPIHKAPRRNQFTRLPWSLYCKLAAGGWRLVGTRSRRITGLRPKRSRYSHPRNFFNVCALPHIFVES
jgi:tRNA threonylcarbamoyl adenosine modification protein YeaZ